jgi:hypothetical protein
MKNFLAVLVITSCLQTTLFATMLGITPAYAATHATFDARSEDISEVAELLLKGYVVVFPMRYLQDYADNCAHDCCIAGSLVTDEACAEEHRFILYTDEGVSLPIVQKNFPVWVPLKQQHLLEEKQKRERAARRVTRKIR